MSDFKSRDYFNKQINMEDTLYQLLSLLPTAYNREVQDVNFYKLFRALAKEFSDAQFTLETINDNTFLETVSGNAIYNNFGVLVKLSREAGWSDEKYRKLVQGLVSSLLIGPTKESMLQAFKYFFDFNVNVYELFKDKVEYLNIPQRYEPRFTFVVELEIPIDLMKDNDSILRQTKHLIKIIKPAHTISLLINIFVGEENYKKHYAIDKKIYNMASRCFDLKIKNKINNRIKEIFESEFVSSEFEDIDSFSLSVRGTTHESYIDQILNVMYDDDNKVVPSARYKYFEYVKNLKEDDIFRYPVPNVLVKELGLNVYDYRTKKDSQEFESFFIEKFTTFNDIISELIKDNYGESKIEDEDLISLYNGKLNDFVVDATYDCMLQKISVYEYGIFDQLKEEAFFNDYNDKTDEYMQDLRDEVRDILKTTDDDEVFEYLETQSLQEDVILDLGGRVSVYNDCLEKSEKYREDLENKYKKFGPYFGMDQSYIDFDINEKEGIYGWKHFYYPTQLKTTTDFLDFKVGGAGLIGPIYAIHDTHIDVDLSYDDYKLTNKLGSFLLSNFTLSTNYGYQKTLSDDDFFSENVYFAKTIKPVTLGNFTLNNTNVVIDTIYPEQVDATLVISGGTTETKNTDYFKDE